MLDVALLGTSGMMPLPNRFLTSMYLRLNGQLLLLDCGEGTQVALKKLGWGFKKLDTILFTHFHADHIAGLPGLLLTVGNSGKTEPLNIVGPKGLEHVVKSLLVIAPELNYPIIYHEMDGPSSYIFGDYHVKSLPVKHGIPCFAYSIEVKRQGAFNLEKAKELDLPKRFWSLLQNDEIVEFDGKTYTPDMVLGDKREGIKVSYCTDSRPTKNLPDFVRDSNLFICEGIYADDEKMDKAKEYMHMTFSDAAKIAKAGSVDELWLTHFSPSLTNPEEHIDVAKNIFPNSKVGEDGKTINLMFPE